MAPLKGFLEVPLDERDIVESNDSSCWPAALNRIQCQIICKTPIKKDSSSTWD